MPSYSGVTVAIFNMGKLKGERRLTFFIQIIEVLGRGSFTGKSDARRNLANQPSFTLRHFMQQPMSSLFFGGSKAYSRRRRGPRRQLSHYLRIVKVHLWSAFVWPSTARERESSVYSQRALHWPWNPIPLKNSASHFPAPWKITGFKGRLKFFSQESPWAQLVSSQPAEFYVIVVYEANLILEGWIQSNGN